MIGLCALGVSEPLTLAVAREEAAGERAPRQQGYTGVLAQGIHFALFFPVQEVVVVLHADEPGPAIFLRHLLGLRKLPRPHAAGAEIADLAGLDHIMQGLHRFLDRRLRVVTVDLVQVYVVGTQALQRSVDRMENAFTAQAIPVRPAHERGHLDALVGNIDRLVDLGSDHGFFASAPRKHLFEELAGQDLRHAARIGVAGVEEIDAKVDRAFDQRPGCVFIHDPGTPLRAPECQHAEADSRNLQAGRAEADVFHAYVSRLYA
ncbi:hypothetical protein D9M72_104140 [compost metagenome]